MALLKSLLRREKVQWSIGFYLAIDYSIQFLLAFGGCYLDDLVLVEK